jgi:wobble nucleotide-excising tRNase
LRVNLNRQLPEVVKLITEYKTTEIDKGKLSTEKGQTRTQLDTLMIETLKLYETKINVLLKQFGAEFEIVQLDEPSYLGTGEPRTNYALKMRNKIISLGSRTDIGSACCFGTSLSEADKRTLAFAFFMARLQIDPNLHDKTIILDDPISSLDRRRRKKSRYLMVDLAQKCHQMIILSHDPYFLRELCECLIKVKPTPINPTIMQIDCAKDNYSAFKINCCLDDICESDYYRHHKIVSHFVDGESGVDSRDIAKAIRPLLEGYYRRRFPCRILKTYTLGKIIREIRNAVDDDILMNLKRILPELSEICEYADPYMHDTNSDADTQPIDDGELRTIAVRSLDLIYKN